MHSLEAYFGKAKDTKKRKADDISQSPSPNLTNQTSIQQQTKKFKDENTNPEIPRQDKKVAINIIPPEESKKGQYKGEDLSQKGKPPRSPSRLTDQQREQLKCQLCKEYMYQSLIAIPCQHHFCGACQSISAGVLPTCSVCFQEVDELRRNEEADEKIQQYLDEKPEFKRSVENMKQMRKDNKHPNGCIFNKKPEIIKSPSKSPQKSIKNELSPQPQPSRTSASRSPEIKSSPKKEVALINNANRPLFWVNRLKFYPADDLLPNMVSLREMLFEDLLRGNSKRPKRTLEFAFVTTFGFNMELIEPLLKSGVKVVLANEWENLSEPRIEKNVEGYSNFTIIRPPKDPNMSFRGAFHPKLWILKFPKFLRVVVATANLSAENWIIFSNGLWFQDFPLKSEVKEQPKKADLNARFNFDQDFRETLHDFLQHIMPNKKPYYELLDFNLDNYHISNIDIVLIPSLPGRFKDEDFDKYGHRRIGAVLKKLMPENKQDKQKKKVVTYQTSSMGNISEKYIKEFLGSILPNYISLDQLKAEIKYKGGITPSGESLLKRFRIIYPAKDYVENSIEGPQYSGCLLLSKDNYERPTFPKNIFHQFQGPDNYFYHEGIIAHLKIFIVTDESGEIDDDTYIYFGSANMSPSAWGRYEKDYNQFTVGHTELGVLIPPKPGSKAKKMELIKHLPFKFPPDKYGKGQVPWVFDLHFDGYK